MSDVEPENITIHEGDEDTPEYDDKGALVKITHSDGSITISLDGSPINQDKSGPTKWFDDLSDKISSDELSRIADDLIRGIEDDIETRKDWLEERADGIKLLGLKIEKAGMGAGAGGAPVEGMSAVRHPLLQEAVLRFQANARAELLPTDGPVKIRVDGNNGNVQEDQLANALENDLNHYLTSVATEYYPDTDRMLLMLGFGGTSFKKVYFCPIRNRPVSETVDAEDLIVNNTATDLANAKRVTHRSYLRPSVVRRLQLLGVYRDIDLSTPQQRTLDAAQQQKMVQQGITESTMRPDDRDREIYECYCELDVAGFEHTKRSKPTGLEIPYRVTIDVSSKQILSIVRNYDEDTKDMPEARATFVKYTFVPGFGFYDIGLLAILGNTTVAVTAGWRELLDAGMFSAFPGFLIAKAGARQKTNILRVPPGGGVEVDTAGVPINQAVMALPYKEPSQALMALVEEMAQTGMRVGGTSELQVGEGRADAPVGTTLAMIDQATKVLNSVHKRLHAAQSEEFRLLAGCFREHPESFWERNKKQTYPWDQETLKRALEDYDLSPQADPNTASHAQRMMKVQALLTLAGTQPALYDPIAVNITALEALGWSNPEQFMAPPEAQAAPPPELIQAQAKMKAEDTKAQASMVTAQARMMDAKAKSGGLAGGGPAGQVDTQADMMNAKAKLMDSQTKAFSAKLSAKQALSEAHEREADRDQETQNDRVRLALETMKEHAKVTGDREHEAMGADKDRALEAHKAAMEHARHADQMILEQQKMEHEAHLSERDRQDEMVNAHLDRQAASQERTSKAKGAKAKPRKKRAFGGAVTADDIAPDVVADLEAVIREEIKSEMAKISRALTAEKVVVRDEKGRIIGTRLKTDED